MADRFSGHAQGSTGSANQLVAVAPSDTVDLAFTSRALWVGGAGNVAVIAAGDTGAVTLVGVPAGTLLPVRARRVMATGTTATSIVALD